MIQVRLFKKTYLGSQSTFLTVRPNVYDHLTLFKHLVLDDFWFAYFPSSPSFVLQVEEGVEATAVATPPTLPMQAL